MSDATVRVALYIKAATTDKADRREADLRTAAGRTPCRTVVAVFADVGVARRRPTRQQAFTAAEAGAFDLLLVDSISDLTGTPHLSAFVEQFHAHGVQVHSIAEQFDSTHLLAKVMLAQLDVLAGRQLDRIRHGRQHAARPVPQRVAAPPASCVSNAGTVVAVQALYQAVSHAGQLWLDALLIAAGVLRRCPCAAVAAADLPCPECGNSTQTALPPGERDAWKGRRQQ